MECSPESFEPGLPCLTIRPKSLSDQVKKPADLTEDTARRNERRKSSTVPFNQNFDGELKPNFFLSSSDGERESVRRRILIEPNFSLQKQTAGKAEKQFRQILLDQGITDEALITEVERGASNSYELGTLQPLRNVHDYVDYSNECLVQNYVKEHAVGNLLRSNTFRYMVLLVIVLNAILIGIETDPILQLKYASALEAIENIIMAAFVLEILLKWYYHFDVFWKGGWNILDFIIVCVLLFFGNLNLKAIGSSRVLRVLRVVRAFRSLRDTPMFSGLSLIFDTIMRSMLDMVNICLLMVIMICLLGVVGVQLFGEVVPDTFGTFSAAVFSIFICQTQRGWVTIFQPFITAGGAYYYGGFIYFVLIITLTSFVLKNMFVAVIVSNLRVEMKLAKEERARKEAKRDNNRAAIKAAGRANSGEDGKEMEEEDTRNRLEPMIEAARGWQAGEGQRRILSPMFLQQISVEELQKYLFLQVALEENLAEYEKLRGRFKEIAFLIKDMNPTYYHDLRKNARAHTSKRKSKTQSAQ